MTLMQFVDAHPWWTLVYLAVIGGTCERVAAHFATAMRRYRG